MNAAVPINSLRFDTLVEESVQAFAGHAVSEVKIPDDYRDLAQPFKGGEIALRSRFYSINDHYELRSVHIFSRKIEVITLFLFPRSKWQLPVYGMEMVLLGPKPIIGVLDGVVLTGARAPSPAAFLQPLHAQYPQMPHCDDQPQWFQECRSGQEVFVRPESADTFDTVGAMHLRAMQLLAAELAGDVVAVSGQDNIAHRQAVNNYMHHHMVNSPGLPLMNSVFGEEWTRDYMGGLLFRQRSGLAPAAG